MTGWRAFSDHSHDCPAVRGHVRHVWMRPAGLRIASDIATEKTGAVMYAAGVVSALVVERMARPVGKRHLRADLTSLRQRIRSQGLPWPRWRSARPGPHKFVGVDAPFPPPGFRNAVRLSGHLARTTRRHRRPLTPSGVWGQSPVTRPLQPSLGRPVRSAAPPTRSVPACSPAPPRPCSGGPSPAVRGATRRAASRFWPATARRLGRRGSAACADRCCRAC